MKRIISLLAIILLITSAACQAAVQLTSSTIEILANGKNFATGSFSVKGGASETIRFKIYPEFFDISDKGKIIVNQEKNDSHSLISRIRFIPNEFTLENGKSQKVRFTVTDLNTLPDGESRLVLFLEDAKPKEVIIKDLKNKTNSVIEIRTRMGIPIYVDKGKFTKSGNLENLSASNEKDEIICKYKVNSTGNSKIRYTGKIQIIEGKSLVKEFDIEGSPVQGGKFVEIENKLPIEGLQADKDYKLRLILTYKDQRNARKNLIKEVDLILKNIPQQKI